MSEVKKFLLKHQNKDGDVGKFIRSCLLVLELSEFVTRDEVLASAQMQYLLECFPFLEEESENE